MLTRFSGYVVVQHPCPKGRMIFWEKNNTIWISGPPGLVSAQGRAAALGFHQNASFERGKGPGKTPRKKLIRLWCGFMFGMPILVCALSLHVVRCDVLRESLLLTHTKVRRTYLLTSDWTNHRLSFRPRSLCGMVSNITVDVVSVTRVGSATGVAFDDGAGFLDRKPANPWCST